VSGKVKTRNDAWLVVAMKVLKETGRQSSKAILGKEGTESAKERKVTDYKARQRGQKSKRRQKKRKK
jgi:hypothetical protein